MYFPNRKMLRSPQGIGANLVLARRKREPEPGPLRYLIIRKMQHAFSEDH